jgi:peptide deformylase
LIENLKHTAAAYNVVSLSANQIGITHHNFFVMAKELAHNIWYDENLYNKAEHYKAILNPVMY